jgi:hypothetical protein
MFRQICTCRSDIDELSKMLGGNERAGFIFGSCSEEQSNKKLQAEKAAVKLEEDKKVAAKVAVKKAA